MKKILLSLSLVTVALAGKAQNCSELFFSEYVEGTNSDKALEIYNPTGSAITIDNDYRIVRYNNGTGSFSVSPTNPTTQQYVILKKHTIQPHDVWVIVIDKRNPNGTGQEIPVSAGLQAVADTFVCPNYNDSYALSHNGNDAISLQKLVNNNWGYVDLIGEIGFDPMIGWANCPPFFGSDCLSSPRIVHTEDHTMIRKSTVKSGRITNDPFNPTVEWDTLTENKLVNSLAVTNQQLGNHTCDCNLVGIKEYKKISEIKMFPNPTTGTSNVSFLSADKKISTVKIFNVFGQLVKSIQLENPSLKYNHQLGLNIGLYSVEITFEDKSLTTEKLIIE